METHIATTDDNGPEQLQVPLGIPIVEDGVNYWYFRRQTRFYTFSWPLARWLARHIEEFDVVHIHALFSFATIPAAFFARRRGVPYIVRPLGTLNEWGMKNRRPWLKKLSFWMLESRILKHAALIHYTSEQERDEANRLPVSAPSEIIPNALPGDSPVCPRGRFRARHPELQGRKIVLFLSRLDAKKGIDLLLSAFAQVRRQIPSAVLVLAGEGAPSFVNGLKAQAEALAIGSEVHWAGFLTGADKWSALADADVFVLPSHSENFGIAVLEAMAAGTPVIVSDQVALHRAITRAHAGLVAARNAGSLAGAIVELLNDPAGAGLMGLNGKRLAEMDYSDEAVTRRLVHVYNGIAN
jgi:glycosyltransferase involved in cell wall biosynthesis